jgi:hypothetical protein
MRAPLELVGRLKSPLQRQIDVKILIGAAANSGDGFDFSGPEQQNILEDRVRELGVLRDRNKPSYSEALSWTNGQ